MTWCRWSSQIVQWSSFCGPQSLRPSGGSQYPLLSAAERSQWWPCRSVSTSFYRWRFSNFKAKICWFFSLLNKNLWPKIFIIFKSLWQIWCVFCWKSSLLNWVCEKCWSIGQDIVKSVIRNLPVRFEILKMLMGMKNVTVGFEVHVVKGWVWGTY